MKLHLGSFYYVYILVTYKYLKVRCHMELGVILFDDVTPTLNMDSNIFLILYEYKPAKTKVMDIERYKNPFGQIDQSMHA